YALTHQYVVAEQPCVIQRELEAASAAPAAASPEAAAATAAIAGPEVAVARSAWSVCPPSGRLCAIRRRVPAARPIGPRKGKRARGAKSPIGVDQLLAALQPLREIETPAQLPAILAREIDRAVVDADQ